MKSMQESCAHSTGLIRGGTLRCWLLVALFFSMVPGGVHAKRDFESACGSATLLKPDVGISTVVGASNGYNYFQIPVAAPGLLRIAVEGSSVEPQLQLMGSGCSARARIRSVYASDVERLLMVETAGDYHVRVRSRDGAGGSVGIRANWIPAVEDLDFELGSRWDAPDECAPTLAAFDHTTGGGTADPPPPMGGLHAAPIGEVEDRGLRVLRSRIDTVTPGDVLAGLPPMGESTFLRFHGRFEDALDADVVTVELKAAGVLSIAADQVGVRGSLYEAHNCTSQGQLAGDVALHSDDGFLQALAPGTYALRLSPSQDDVEDYGLDIRFLPSR